MRVLFTIWLCAISASVFAFTQSEALRSYKCHNTSSNRCFHFNRNLTRDSKNCFLPKSRVENFNQFILKGNSSKMIKVRGSISYRGFFPGKYKYNVYRSKSGQIIIYSNFYFQNRKYNDPGVQMMKRKLKKASEIWTSKNPFKNNVRFIFQVVDKRSKAHFDARLIDGKTRGPYFMTWTTAWSPYVVAHEIGHMLGLDDEYEGSKGCPTNSIMCYSSSTSKYYPFHYYMIFRRILCSA